LCHPDFGPKNLPEAAGCSLLHDNMVSIYHNTQCSISDDNYQPSDIRIPPLPISLIDSEKQNILRRTDSNDLIQNNIVVLFHQELQAFQCIAPTHLQIDGQDALCTNQTMIWIEKPTSVIHKESGERIMEHTNFKSTHIVWDLQTSTPPRDISDLLLKPFNQTIMHDVKHFLKSVNKVHMAIFSSAIFIALTCCCLPLCSCLCCPGVVKALTKCCINYGKGTHRLVLHQRAMKERKRYKDLMKPLGHPAV
jgi:hypothetical protein